MSFRISGSLLRAGQRRLRAVAMLGQRAIPLFLLLCGSPVSAVEVGEVSARLFHLQLSLAQKGDHVAQYYVAEMYERGLGTERDMNRAFDWYGQSAAQGYAPAKLRVAAWKRNSVTADSAPIPETPVGEIAPAPVTPPAMPNKTNKPKPPAPATHRGSVKTDKLESQVREKQPVEPAEKPGNHSIAARNPEPAPAVESIQPVPTAVVAPASNAAGSGVIAVTATPAAAGRASQPSAAATENAAPDPGVAAAEETPFMANPCMGPSARFLSHCRRDEAAGK